MPDFLFEIGLEEVPARMIAAAQAELQQRIVALLDRERLATGPLDAQSFSTPRRLAIIVHGVPYKQLDLSEQIMGPALKNRLQGWTARPRRDWPSRKSPVSP